RLEGVNCGKICRIGNTRDVDITNVVYGIRSSHVITAAAEISGVDKFAICTHLNDKTIERAAAISLLHGVRSWKIHGGGAPYDISVPLSVHRYEPGTIFIGAAEVGRINQPGTIRIQLRDETVKVAAKLRL